MRRILRENNLDLLREVRRMREVLIGEEDRIPPEMETYYEWALRTCKAFEERIEQNLAYLDQPSDDILQNVHSRTQNQVRAFRLFDQLQVSPIIRANESDRLPLNLLQWLHRVHPKIQDLPVAVGDGSASIIVSSSGALIREPVLYRLPSSIQRGLLYLPLLFHEVGHQLYQVHKPEMDALVRELQRRIQSLLKPSVRRDDSEESKNEERRNAIVETWYEWAQEVFCDAMGLTIGGPAYLHAFSMFVRMHGKSQFHEDPENLKGRDHPIGWIRIRLLAERARRKVFTEEAEVLETDWSQVASAHGVTENYYGYYDGDFRPGVQETVDYMLIEANPWEMALDEDLSSADLGDLAGKPAHLLNRAWHLFREHPEGYREWEERAIEAFLVE